MNMVENLLSVTRIQDDTGTVKKEDEVVEEVVSEAIIRLKRRLPDIEIHVSAPEDVLIIPMDPLYRTGSNESDGKCFCSFRKRQAYRPSYYRKPGYRYLSYHRLWAKKRWVLISKIIPHHFKRRIQPHVHRIPTVAWESVFLSATLLSRHMAEKLPHIIMQMALNFYLHYQRGILNHE